MSSSRYWIALPAMLILVAAAGVALTLYLAWHKALDMAAQELDGQLGPVMKGSADARAQELEFVRKLGEGAPVPACSAAHMARMRAAYAPASHLQGVGVVSGNTLLCSTLTAPGTRMDLGEPDRVYGDGFQSWTRVRLPGVDVPFKIDVRDGYAMMLLPDQVIDVAEEIEGISLAHIGMVNDTWTVVRRRGNYDFERLLPYSHGARDRFWQDGQFIITRPVETPRAVFIATMDRSRVLALFQDSIADLALGAVLIILSLAALAVYALRRHFSLRTAIRRALKRREFHLFYQPVMSLESGRFVGAEALLRWTRADGRQMSPNVFIPAAERTGLIGDVTQRVIDLVADDVARLVHELPDAHVAINLAPSDVDSPHTQVWLTRMVERAGVCCENVVVEITERGALQPHGAKEKLTAMRTRGFRLAIDDFGTGQSSLSQIATYNFDFLKIDKSFVDVICTDTLSRKVAFNVIHLAKSLGMQMIAEGVETKEQSAELRRAGVQYAQGWLFAKAMPFEDLLRFARGHA